VSNGKFNCCCFCCCGDNSNTGGGVNSAVVVPGEIGSGEAVKIQKTNIYKLIIYINTDKVLSITILMNERINKLRIILKLPNKTQKLNKTY
jgi:hypothetical protein